jgi:hypothetical protein
VAKVATITHSPLLLPEKALHTAIGGGGGGDATARRWRAHPARGDGAVSSAA